MSDIEHDEYIQVWAFGPAEALKLFGLGATGPATWYR